MKCLQLETIIFYIQKKVSTCKQVDTFSMLFEFNSSRWLRSNIIHYSINTAHFIDDSIHSFTAKKLHIK